MGQGIPPPILFLKCQKENGRWSRPREKTLARNLRVRASSLKYGGCSSELPPKLYSPTGAHYSPLSNRRSPRLYPWRSSLVVEEKPVFQAPLTLPRRSQRSASGNRRRGCPEPPNPLAIHAAGRDFPKIQNALSPRKRFFSWTVHGPFSFWGAKKRMGGAFPPAKPASSPRRVGAKIPAPLRRESPRARAGAKGAPYVSSSRPKRNRPGSADHRHF